MTCDHHVLFVLTDLVYVPASKTSQDTQAHETLANDDDTKTVSRYDELQN